MRAEIRILRFSFYKKEYLCKWRIIFGLVTLTILTYQIHTSMKKTKFYSAPELEYLPMQCLEMLCDSAVGGTEDYDLITDFEW